LNTLAPAEQIQKMLAIIHQIPLGLIETDIVGNVKQINAKGVQLLLPLFLEAKLAPTNLLNLLKLISPDLVAKMEASTVATGSIINQERYSINRQDEGKEVHYLFSVNKLSSESYMYTFDDITEMYKNEQVMSQALQDKAVEQSKFEIASGVLHDIGNAVVGFGSYVTKIKRNIEQSDTGTLNNLKHFIYKQKSAIGNAIGEAKANALLDLLDGVISNMEQEKIDIKKSIGEQLNIISHIHEILNIQRQYVKGQSSDRLPVNLRSIINDSTAMLLASFDKKGVQITSAIPIKVPAIKGDRTKLMQVILNLLKNAVEAVFVANVPDKSVHIELLVNPKSIDIIITDNGLGFEGINGDHFFGKGVTSKSEGTGLGLGNCKSIIESHNGTIHLKSKGVGLGATVTVSFNI